MSDAVRAQAERVWRLKDAGWSQARIAQELGLSPTQVSYLATLRQLVPDAWEQVSTFHAAARAALARLAPAAQRAILADPAAPRPLTASWLLAAARAARHGTPPPSGAADSEDGDELAVLRADAARLRREIAQLERALGARRTGLEIAARARRIAAELTELEALLTGVLDGLFVPEVLRWRATAVRALAAFDALLERLQHGETVEWWTPPPDSDEAISR